MSTPQEYKHSFIGPGCQDSSYFFHIGGCQDSWQQMKRRKKEEKGKTVRDGRTQVAIFSCVTNWPSTTRKLKAEHIVSFFFLLLPYCSYLPVWPARFRPHHQPPSATGYSLYSVQRWFFAAWRARAHRPSTEWTRLPLRSAASCGGARVASRCLPSQSSHTRAASRSELSFWNSTSLMEDYKNKCLLTEIINLTPCRITVSNNHCSIEFKKIENSMCVHACVWAVGPIEFGRPPYACNLLKNRCLINTNRIMIVQ
jgi:hypothetical protein